jgi:acyl carrier protein
VSVMSEDQLIDLVVEWLKKNRGTIRLASLEVTPDTDLIASGLLDSFAFVDLIVFIESQSGCKVELSDADPSDFCVVRGLCRIALNAHS